MPINNKTTDGHRHGPKGGYNFRNKQTYRRKLWDFVDEHLPVRKKKDATVVVLDTSEGLEVRELLRRGYRPERIHAVNKNVAHVASMTRGLDADGLPRVQTHGDLLEVLDSVGPVHAVNFDACAAILWGSIDQAIAKQDVSLFWGSYLHAVAKRVVPGGVLAHTFLVGRETGEGKGMASEYRGIMVEDRGRTVPASYLKRLQFALFYLRSPCGECVLHTTRLTYDWYASTAGSQRMLWFATKLMPHGHLPMSPHQWLTMIRRLYPKYGDRFLGLMVPVCCGLSGGLVNPEDDVLYNTGTMRFRHISSGGGGGVAGGDETGDDDFNPCDTGFNKPPSHPMRL